MNFHGSYLTGLSFQSNECQYVAVTEARIDDVDIAVAAWHEDGRWSLSQLPDAQDLPGVIDRLKSLQTNGGATTANQVLIGSTQQAVGFTLSNNAITVVNAGTYFISANLQLAFTQGASNYNVTVWYTIDDVLVPNSAFTFTTTSAQNDQTLATITDTLTVTAGQYLKFYWWSQATGMKLLETAAGINPTRPLSPSVNINLFNVG
jgi:hypothetical protein